MNEIEKDLHIAFVAPLNEGDTENQTYGCCKNSPDICGSNAIPGVCAFATTHYICSRKPSRVWTRKYQELKMKNKFFPH
mgnify:CR=1 FL=1